MKNRNIHSSIFFIGFGILYLLGSLEQGLTRKGIPGPGFFPFISALILIAISLMVFSLALKNNIREPTLVESTKFFPEKGSLKKILITLFALFAYGTSLEYLGFFFTTFFFLFFITMIITKQKRGQILIYAFLAAIFSYIIFVTLLGMYFPTGIFGI